MTACVPEVRYTRLAQASAGKPGPDRPGRAESGHDSRLVTAGRIAQLGSSRVGLAARGCEDARMRGCGAFVRGRIGGAERAVGPG